jgi:hypothetical protein
MLGNKQEAFIGFYKNNMLNGKALYYSHGILREQGIFNDF